MEKRIQEMIVTEVYHRVIRDLLTSSFASSNEVGTTYASIGTRRQREIEKEIDLRSREIARLVVKKMKERNLLEIEPSDAVLWRLLQDSFEEVCSS